MNVEVDLKSACRGTIRRHLIEINPHSNLFNTTARLGLPSRLRDFLLYNVSLENEDNNAANMILYEPRESNEILSMPIW